MTLIQKLNRLNTLKFSFAKSTKHARAFAADVNACFMYLAGVGLGIPADLSAESQLRGVFLEVMRQNGIFLFNISGVDLNKGKKEFFNYEEVEANSQITEWELHQILVNSDYLKSTIFHNGKAQFKKRLLWKSVKS